MRSASVAFFRSKRARLTKNYCNYQRCFEKQQPLSPHLQSSPPKRGEAEETIRCYSLVRQFGRQPEHALHKIYGELFYNFERGALAMARGGAGKQRSDSVDGLPAAANHAANVALAQLKFENGCSAARNFREHHVVGIFDQLPNDELEKFSHDGN
jgi:hypothetical protein